MSLTLVPSPCKHARRLNEVVQELEGRLLYGDAEDLDRGTLSWRCHVVPHGAAAVGRFC